MWYDWRTYRPEISTLAFALRIRTNGHLKCEAKPRAAQLHTHVLLYEETGKLFWHMGAAIFFSAWQFEELVRSRSGSDSKWNRKVIFISCLFFSFSGLLYSASILFSFFVISCNYPLFQSCLTGDRFLRREAKSFLPILAIRPPDRRKQYRKLMQRKQERPKSWNLRALKEGQCMENASRAKLNIILYR